MSINTVIQKLFLEHDFNKEVELENGIYFNQKGNEYYIYKTIKENELIGYLNENKEINNIIRLFKEHKEDLKDQSIDKNTSLILFIEVDNIREGYLSNLNSLLKFEENEYWFKRYAILYSREAYTYLDQEGEILPVLESKTSLSTEFEEYEKDILQKPDYFLAMQLYIKLPFLKVNNGSKLFTSIDEAIGGIDKKIKKFIFFYENNLQILDDLDRSILGTDSIADTYLEDLRRIIYEDP